MAIFEDVFNKASIYEMLFFNVKSVLIYPTLDNLETENKQLYDQWNYIQKTNRGFSKTTNDEIYLETAPKHPEFCKIVAISYATVHMVNGTLKRSLTKIVDVDEFVMISQFMDVLDVLSSDSVQSDPKYFPTLCGFDITSNDIPLLIKRYLYHRNKFENKHLPLILKRSLNIKPWESGVIDISNVWRFNGNTNNSLMLISELMGLKKSVDLLNIADLSKYYWDHIEVNATETLEHVSLQSATHVNLVIQLVNELRQL